MDDTILKLMGYSLSPYVRKVRVVLEQKKIAYEHDPVNPFTELARLRPINPNGAVPVLMIDDQPMAESSAICHWLDDTYPGPALYPGDPIKRAKVEELERWSDDDLVQSFGSGLFFQRVIKPFFLNKPIDEGTVQENLAVHIPETLRSLEDMLQEDGFLVGELSVADFAIGAWLRAGMLVGVSISSDSHPKLSGYLHRLFALPAYSSIIQSENELDLTQEIRDGYGASVIE